MAKTTGKSIFSYMLHDWNYYGTNGDDRMLSGGHDDLLSGKGGDDVIGDARFSRRSNDVFLGGSGDDKLTSLNGDDFLFGGKGDDTMTVLETTTLDVDVVVDGGAGEDVLVLTEQKYGGEGAWYQVENPDVEQTISVGNRWVTFVNVEMIYV